MAGNRKLAVDREQKMQILPEQNSLLFGYPNYEFLRLHAHGMGGRIVARGETPGTGRNAPKVGISMGDLWAMYGRGWAE